MTAWMLMSTLFAAEPAAVAPKAAKVYVVYVTVVEIDAEGNETVLFTPKVQTTGNPAGATVEHVDGRSFEFNCKMALSSEPALERPPTVAATPKPNSGSAQPGLLKRASNATTKESPANQSLSRAFDQKPKAAARPADEFYVRTYDVSALLDGPANSTVTESHFTPLIQTIKTFADVESWNGKATIKPFISTKSLVIKQNEAGHKAVAEAIAKLRPAEK